MQRNNKLYRVACPDNLLYTGRGNETFGCVTCRDVKTASEFLDISYSLTYLRLLFISFTFFPTLLLQEDYTCDKIVFSRKILECSSLHAPLLQVIDGVVSLALCPHVVSQASQHFRSS